MSVRSNSPKPQANSVVYCLFCTFEMKREVQASQTESREVREDAGVASAFTWQPIQQPGSMTAVVVPVCFRHVILPNTSGLMTGNDVLGG